MEAPTSRGSEIYCDTLLSYPPLNVAVNTAQSVVQVNIGKSDTSSTLPHQTTGRHRVVRMVGGDSDSRRVSVTGEEVDRVGRGGARGTKLGTRTLSHKLSMSAG